MCGSTSCKYCFTRRTDKFLKHFSLISLLEWPLCLQREVQQFYASTLAFMADAEGRGSVSLSESSSVWILLGYSRRQGKFFEACYSALLSNSGEMGPSLSFHLAAVENSANSSSVPNIYESRWPPRPTGPFLQSCFPTGWPPDSSNAWGCLSPGAGLHTSYWWPS